MKLRNKKTGEVVDFKIIADYDDYTSGWRLEKQDGTVLFYDHIDEIHEDWEDVEGTNATNMPLIKDPKIRKAVRAWAEANGTTKLTYDGFYILTDEQMNDIEFGFSKPFEELEKGEEYTIVELCGEEED